MSLDKYQLAWRSEASQVHVTFDADSLTKEVQQSHEAFRSTIFWRDVREVGVALVLIPIWIAMGVSSSLLWTWYLTVPALLWIAGFMLVDRRLHPQHPSDPGEPLLFYAKESLNQVEHQIWLLRNVFWWYLLPPSISLMAFLIQCSWETAESWWGAILMAALFGVFLFLLYFGIYWLNQRAVRKQLEPRRNDLQKIINNLEGDGTADNATEMTDLVSALSGTDGNWSAWSENWNRIIPSWREVTFIVVPTLAGAYLGFRYPLTDMGPVFFQSVVAAVIPFEIAFFSLWYLSYRRYKGQPLSGTGKVNPNAAAIATIVMIVLMAILAFAAILSCMAELKSRRGLGLEDISVLVNKPAADLGKISPERLVGRYQLTPNFIFDVKYKDGHLMVGITNQPTQEVFADSPTKWSYRGIDAKLEFHLRAEGPAYALTLHQNGLAQKAKRIR